MLKLPFNNLEIPMFSVTMKAENHYRVYSSPGEFTLIEAPTAFEAIEKSGISNPYRIIHLVYDKKFSYYDEIKKIETITSFEPTSEEKTTDRGDIPPVTGFEPSPQN